MSLVQSKFEKFVRDFGSIDHSSIVYSGKYVYEAKDELVSISKNVSKKPFSMGLFLGEVKRDFMPSFALLDKLKNTENKIVIDDESVWLFLCKRDVFEEHVISAGEVKDVFMVLNEGGEVLGLARFSKKGKKKLVKPVLDRGNFLRRER